MQAFENEVQSYIDSGWKVINCDQESFAYMHFYKKISYDLYFFFSLFQMDGIFLLGLIIQRTLWQFRKFLYQQF